MLVAKFVVSGNFDTSSAEGKHAINWVKALGEELAKVCYSTVPVKTGNLRSSMYLSPNSRGGFELFYLAPYAYSVHEGAAREPDFSGNYSAKTRRHRRRLPNGNTVAVREHTKVYKAGYKPVASINTLWTSDQKSSWSTQDVLKTRTPNPWIQKAWKMIVSRVDKLGASVLPVELVIERYVGGKPL